MPENERKYFAIIPAAGSGSRSGLDTPKQFHTLHNRTVIEHAIAPFLAHPKIERIVVVLSQPNPYWSHLSIANHPKIMTVAGGAERMDSVLNGLQAIASLADPDDWVLVHDAARPCLTVSLITQLLMEVADHPVGGLLAVKVRDTLKFVPPSGGAVETRCRENVYQAQTPQMFRYQLLQDAIGRAQALGEMVSDEAQALERMGYSPKIVPGCQRNIKLTYPEDNVLLEHHLFMEGE